MIFTYLKGHSSKGLNLTKKRLVQCFLSLGYVFYLKVQSSSYLTVSVVIFICWWICIRKVDRAMFSKEWLVQFRERQPGLKGAKFRNVT